MTESVATAVLIALEADVAEQVIDLLAEAGVVAVDRAQPDGLTAIVVRSTDLAASQETLGRALPGLLATAAGELPPDPAGSRLSDRLIRRGADEEAPMLHDPAAEDDYIPPAPPPLPSGDLVSRLAWLGAVGGPMLMVISVLLNLSSAVAAAGLVGFVVGFGILIARMPDRAPRDDGWDDGAVV